MIQPGIKSRPVYPGLKPDRFAKSNIIVVDADGREAVMDMAKAVDEKFWLKSTVLFNKAGLSGNDGVGSLAELESANLWVFPTLDTLISRLNGLLTVSRMGTRLYAAGNEPLLGSVIKTALAHGIAHNSVFTEHRGSLRRRMQCVHCKGCTDDVTTNPARCSHCGLMLLVRDHYSRRIGAFQGVRIDAEVPGEIPEIKAEFL
jgi:hypothetical protein